jgi:hypothetical protein
LLLSYRLASVAFVLLAVIRIVSTYHVFNQTFDEPISVACGMEWLDRGTYISDPKHPPLGRVATALALYLDGVRSPTPIGAISDGNRILGSGDTYKRRLTWARLSVLPFFLLSCGVLWAWTRWAFGETEAAIAVLLFSFAPPVLGHAGIAMTDIALTAMLSLALFSFCRWLDLPSTGRSLALGAAVGAAVLSKFTAIPFLVVCGGLIGAARSFSSPKWQGRRALTGLLIAAAVASLVVWGGYRFTVGHIVLPGGSTVPLPAPAFFGGLRALMAHNHEGLPNYFLGERSLLGWVYYYPVVVFAKSPAGLIALFLCGIFLIARHRPVLEKWERWTPVLVVAGMLIVGTGSNINIGVRHLLPIYVPLAGVAAFGAVRLFHAGRLARVACVALIAWQVASSVRAHPDYLAYFNEVVRADNGEFGIDTDLDYGQDLWRLAEACKRRNIQSLWIAYHGTAELEQLAGIQTRPLPTDTREDGWIAVSMFKLKLGDGNSFNGYSWLEALQPVERVGKSIRLYFVPSPGR